jgi:hypothetical protein
MEEVIFYRLQTLLIVLLYAVHVFLLPIIHKIRQIDFIMDSVLISGIRIISAARNIPF